MQLVPPKKTPSRVVGAINKPTQNFAKAHADEANFTPFKVSVDQVYSAHQRPEIYQASEATPVKPEKGSERGSVELFMTVCAIIPWITAFTGANSRNW